MDAHSSVNLSWRVPATLDARNGGSPLFIPAIYEYKASLVGETPSATCRNADLLFRGLMAEYESLEPDALTIGLDVYNVEAEALGCTVQYDSGSGIPAITFKGRCVDTQDDLHRLPAINPLTSGRMPLNLEVARRLRAELGPHVWMRGAVSGPCSLAVSLAGTERFFMALIMEPDFARALIQCSAEVIKAYACAFLDVGVDVVIFDSQATPELLSPAMFEDFIAPTLGEIISDLKQHGAASVPLIIGGNTAMIVPSLLETGANNLLCDFKADWPTWREAVGRIGRAIRRNCPIDWLDLEDEDEIFDRTCGMIREAGSYGGYIQGTPVVPPGTPVGRLKAMARACRHADLSTN